MGKWVDGDKGFLLSHINSKEPFSFFSPAELRIIDQTYNEK